MTEPIDITAILGSVTPPGRLRRAVEEALRRSASRGDALQALPAGRTVLSRGSVAVPARAYETGASGGAMTE
jgi:hypothetical protein